MNLFKMDLLNKNLCLLNLDLILLLSKLLITFGIFFCLPSFSFVWIWFTWAALTIAIDLFLVIKNPKAFREITLSEDEQTQYGLTSQELIKYLSFAPKFRLLLISSVLIIIMVFFSPHTWEKTLFLGLVFCFVIFNLVAIKLFNIKPPFIFNSQDQDLGESMMDSHRNDSGFPGTPGWNALQTYNSSSEVGRRHNI